MSFEANNRSVSVRSVSVLAALAALLAAGGAGAHHSFSAEFDGNKPVRLVGKLQKAEWTNPHTYFFLDVEGKDGKVDTWVLEASNPGALSRRGFKKGDIKLGDTLVVDGYLAKDGSHLADARRVKLPDGRIVFGGTVGDGGPGGAREAPGSAPPAKEATHAQ
jgi:hypothetical protein